MASSKCQTCVLPSPTLSTLLKQSSVCQGRSVQVPCAVPKKLNTLDKGYKKTWFGQGYFMEDKEQSGANIYENIEKKKLLSTVEEAGILSSLEKAGVSLTKIEESGVLSTAENLGLLSLAEGALQSDPGNVTALSLPLIVATILSLVLLPGDNAIEGIVKLIVSGGFAAGATACIAGGFFIAYLQEEE